MPANKKKKNKRALIVVNLLGFITFLKNDFKLMGELGFDFELAGNGKMADGSDAVEVPMLADAGIPFHQVDFDTKNPLASCNIGAYQALRALINHGGYDLIVCHTPIPGVFGRLAARPARRSGARVVYVTHGFSFGGCVGWKTKVIFRMIESVMSRYCDAIITINREDFAAAKSMHAPRVFYIPGVGVDTKAIHDIKVDRRALRESLGLGPDDVAVLCVGELSHRKNQAQAIRAIGLLEDRSRHVLLICGRSVVNSHIEDDLKAEAKERGVRLKLLGHRSDVGRIMKACDMLLLPSLREGLGLVGIEALAAGLPVVGSDVQGIRDYIQDGVNGFLCAPGDDEAWAEAIQRTEELLTANRDQLSKRCFESGKEFDENESYAAISQAYEIILRG